LFWPDFFVATRLVNVASAHSLGFSIYTNTSTLLPLFKTYYANATGADALMDDAYSPVARAYFNYWSTPQVFGRIMLANNYSELTSTSLSPYINDAALAAAYNFSGNDYMGYDSEDWVLTPTAEQNAQAQYTQEACNYVHNAGYKFAFTPEIDVPGWGQFAQINWTCVDFLDLQEQFLSTDPASMANNVTQLITIAKDANPNLVVFVQLDIAGDSISATQAEIESGILLLSQIPGVNGVILQDLCATSSCNSTLTDLVNYIKGISGGSSTTTASTSTTPSTTTSSTTKSTTSKTTAPTTTILNLTSTTSTSSTSSTSSITNTTSTTKRTTTTKPTTTISNTTNATTSSSSSTTTINSTISTSAPTTIDGGGGGGSGGGGGGGGGSSAPSLSYSGLCAVITGVAAPDSFTFEVGGQTFSDVVDNYVGSNYTSIIVNGDTYLLYQRTMVQIGNSSYIKLLNVSYLPILHSVTLQACPDITVTSTTTVSTVPSTTTAQSNVSNKTSSAPLLAAPSQNKTNETPSIESSAVTPTIPQSSYSPQPATTQKQSPGSNYLWMAMIGSLFIIVPAGIVFTRSRLIYRPELGILSTYSLR